MAKTTITTPRIVLPTKKTKPNFNISEISVMVYGEEKIGKSLWCSGAPNALYLATEPAYRHLEVYAMDVRGWAEFCKIVDTFLIGKHDFKSLIIDTVDDLYKIAAAYLIKKHNVEDLADFDYGKGFNLVYGAIYAKLRQIVQSKYGLYLVSHMAEKEIKTRVRTYTKITPAMTEKFCTLVTGLVDIIFYCDYHISKKGDKRTVTRVLRCDKNPGYVAGDRFGVLPIMLPLNKGHLISSWDIFAKAFNKGR